MNKSETEYLILRKLEENPRLTQREISKELGVSLGKTNYVIKALIDKGWLKLNNFKNKINFNKHYNLPEKPTFVCNQLLI